MEITKNSINQLQSSSYIKMNWRFKITKLKITDAKLYVPIVTLSTKDIVNLSKQLSNEFKRSVYWKRFESLQKE